MKRKRTVVHVVFNAETTNWEGVIAGMVIGVARTRANMLTSARRSMRHIGSYGINSQVVVHRKDGRIGFEYTYLNDPSSTRG